MIHHALIFRQSMIRRCVSVSGCASEAHSVYTNLHHADNRHHVDCCTRCAFRLLSPAAGDHMAPACICVPVFGGLHLLPCQPSLNACPSSTSVQGDPYLAMRVSQVSLEGMCSDMFCHYTYALTTPRTTTVRQRMCAHSSPVYEHLLCT